MIDYTAIMTRRHPGREWLLNGDDYDGLVMLDGGTLPSKKSLDDEWESVKAEIETEQETKANARISARNKLAALGLTEAEIKALVG